MSDHDAENMHEEQQQQQHADHINEMFTPDSDQEFTFTEERKPLNRNVIVLVLITLVGASLVYLMYLRGRFTSISQTPEQAEASATVTDWMQRSDANIQKMQAQLADTEKKLKAIQANPGEGQVAGDKLTGNPFGFTETAPQQVASVVTATPADPNADVNRAIQKINVQMILYSGASSSVQINNWVYKVGDTLNVESVPFVVKAISRDSVVLKHARGETTVTPAGAKGI